MSENNLGEKAVKARRFGTRSATKHALVLAGIGALSVLGGAGCSSSGLPGNGGAEEGAPEAEVLSPDTTDVATNESSLNLVAQLGLPGRVIKFFEPVPGVLLTMETGRMGQVKLDPEEAHLSGSALYAYLAKGPAPQALVDAEARATPTADSVDDVGTTETGDAAKARVSTGPSLQPQDGWKHTPRPGDLDWFFDKFCVATDRYWENRWVTGTGWIKTTGTNMMQAGAYSRIGEIEYDGYYQPRATLEGNTAVRGTVFEGWYAGWRYASGSQAKAQSRVDTPAGGTYEHCVNYHF
jgi:hypothetical protein